MKSLYNYIEEKLVINKEYKNADEFLYRVFDDSKMEFLRIFSEKFGNINFFNHRIYLNDEPVELLNDGKTRRICDPDDYRVIIKDLDYTLTNCNFMFFDCKNLIKVIEFDTKGVQSMHGMFWGCDNLVEVPLFDISNVRDMMYMFRGCNSLSQDTINRWSKVYDFEKDDKIK